MSTQLKSPFRSPNKLTVTQEYGSTSNLSWYKANGVDITSHNGTDIVFGNNMQTYGTECICPFDIATVVKVTWDTPTSTKGNGVTIESETINGVRYQIVFWHTGEIKVKLGDKLKLGDVICYIGNSGLVTPKPTDSDPWAGSHCHLMVCPFTFNSVMWIASGWINPRDIFNFNEWYNGKDTGFGHDIWVLVKFLATSSGQWVVQFFKNK